MTFETLSNLLKWTICNRVFFYKKENWCVCIFAISFCLLTKTNNLLLLFITNYAHFYMQRDCNSFKGTFVPGALR